MSRSFITVYTFSFTSITFCTFEEHIVSVSDIKTLSSRHATYV